MSTATEKTESDIDLYRLTASQFETIVDTGVFGDDKVELLGGHLVKLMTSDERHITTVDSVFRALLRLLPETSWYVRDEKPVTLSRRWRPLPDITVLRGSLEEYKQEGRKPGPADVVVLVEVSDTTYSKDSGRKLRKYARTGVQAYWIVDINRRLVEVYSGPGSSGYGAPEIHREADAVPVVIDGKGYGQVFVADLLPRGATGAKGEHSDL